MPLFFLINPGRRKKDNREYTPGFRVKVMKSRREHNEQLLLRASFVSSVINHAASAAVAVAGINM